MKLKRIFGFLVVGLVMSLCSVAFTSCSDDDDDDGVKSSNASIQLDGSVATFSYVGYLIEDDDDYAGIDIIFADFNLNKLSSMPAKGNMFTISIEGSFASIPTGTFSGSDYDLTLMYDYNFSSEDGDYYEEATNNGSMTISKDGGNYTISIPNMVLSDDYERNKISTSFSYTGGISKLNWY